MKSFLDRTNQGTVVYSSIALFFIAGLYVFAWVWFQEHGARTVGNVVFLCFYVRCRSAA